MTVCFYLDYLEFQGKKWTIWIMKQTGARKHSFISYKFFFACKNVAVRNANRCNFIQYSTVHMFLVKY